MFYNGLKKVLRAIFYWFYQVSILDPQNLALDGAAILAANHIGNNDPILMHLLIRPKVHIMAKKELFRFRPLGALFRYFGAFPIERGAGDLGALGTAFDVVNRGDVLGIFPEGTRNKSGELKRFQPGTAVISVRTRTPVVLVYFTPFRAFRKTAVAVSQPIRLWEVFPDLNLADVASMREATDYLRQQMQTLQQKGWAAL